MKKNYQEHILLLLVMNNIDLIFIVPARKGSKRVKNKNFKLLDGKPLIYYTFDFIRKVSKKQIYLTTDYKISKKLVEKYNLEIIKRPTRLASSSAKSVDVIKHCLKNIKKKNKDRQIVVYLQPTVPFRNIRIFREAIRYFKNNKSIQTVSSYIKNPFYQCKAIAKINSNNFADHFIKKKIKSSLYVLDGAFYFFDRKLFESKNIIFKEKNKAVINDFNTHFNIDNILDWNAAKTYKSKLKK